MNRIYRTLWNRTLGLTQVVCEQARGARKAGSAQLLTGLGLSALLSSPLVQALPENGSADSLAGTQSLALDAALDWSLAGAWASTTARSVDVGADGSLKLSGAISGTGALSKSGAGTLLLSGANTFSGATTVTGGTLVAASNSALGTSAGTVTVNGTLSRLEVASGVTLSNQTLDLKNGATLLNNGTINNTLTSTNSYGVGGTGAQGNVENHGQIRGTRAGVGLAGNSTTKEISVSNSGETASIIGAVTPGGGSTGNGITLSGGSAALQITGTISNRDGAKISGNTGGYGIQSTDFVTTHILNSGGASISGGTAAVSLGGRNSSLGNTDGAKVNSTGSTVVELKNGGRVENDGLGSDIVNQGTSGGGTGINIAGYAGEVINSNGALIKGGMVSGVGVSLLSGSVQNTGGASIESGGTAVRISNSTTTATLLNEQSRITSATAAAVSIAGVGQVENREGVIQGWTRGLTLGAGGSVLNQGKNSVISAVRNDRLEPPVAAFGDSIRVTGISMTGGAGTVENLDGATVYGYTRGIWLEKGGSVLNAGAGSRIEGERNFGVVISGGTAQLENRDGAVITGGVTSSSANGASAVVAFGAGGDLLNQGSGSAITGNADFGVLIQCSSGCSSSNLYNLDGALISGGRYGVFLTTDVPQYTLPNGKTSTLNPQGANYALQLVNSGAGSLISSGYGVYTSSSLASIYNLDGAQIQGTVQAVNLAGGGLLINDRSSRIIGGSEGAVLSSGAAITLHNEGSISGKVELSGNYANTVYLHEGSTLLGDLDIGANSASQLILSGDERQRYSDAVSGSTLFNGTLLKQGNGTWNLDSTLNHHGDTLIEQGTLAVNGSIAHSAVTVRDGARLGGNGTVGAAHIEAGGTLAPGNSIGSLTVNGDLVLDPGATFSVEVDANGNADQVIVNGGTAYLNGSNLQLSLLSPTANYRAGVQNAILTADAISGTFGQVLGNPFAFLDFSMNYSGTSVTQAITRNSVQFADFAQTRNQRAAAGALDSLGNVDLYNRVSTLTGDQAPAAFDSLSGELHASLNTALLQDSHVVREASLQRSTTQRGTGQTFDNGLTLWTQASNAQARLDGNHNAASLKHELNSLVLGVDGQSGDWTLGVLSGISDGSLNLGRRDSSADTTGYQLGGYASRRLGPLNLRLGASQAWYDIDSKRESWSNEHQQLKGRYNARVSQAFSEIGYPIEQGNSQLEPFVGLTQVQVKSDGFHEKGGDSRLQGKSASNDLTLLGVGLRHRWKPADSRFEWSSSLAWQRAVGQTDTHRTLAFDGSETFKVAGLEVPRDVLQASVQGRLALAPGLHATLGYNGELGNDGQANALQAGLDFSF